MTASADIATVLPLIWAALIGVAVALYVLLDGFDLGIGILFPFARNDADRDRMLASIAPFWDGNETWLVLGGGGLLVAFPRAYAIIMPAFYLPIIVMLLALVFRGVTFEFRWHGAAQAVLERGFAAGSTIAAYVRASSSAARPGRQDRRTAPMPADRSTGRRRSACCAGSAWWPAMRSLARPG